MSMDEKMALWQSKQYSSELDMISPEIWDDGMDIDDAFEHFPELQEYSDMLLRSCEFSWLLNSVRNQVKLEIPGQRSGRGQIQIRQTIIGALEEPNRFSRNVVSCTHSMVFQVSWLWDFFDAQEYGMSPSEALGRVLVLTGIPCNSWATTCSRYVCTVWPDIGADVLAVLEELLRRGSEASVKRVFLIQSTVCLG